MIQDTRRETSRELQVLKKKECCDLVVNNLNHFITIPIQGKLTQKTIFQLLIGMAVSQQSFHSISHSLTLSPCETSLRYHLNLLNISELEEMNCQILSHSVHDVLKTGHPYHFAIDFNHDPYYGEIVKDNEEFVSRNRIIKTITGFIPISHYMSSRKIVSSLWRFSWSGRVFQKCIISPGVWT